MYEVKYEKVKCEKLDEKLGFTTKKNITHRNIFTDFATYFQDF